MADFQAEHFNKRLRRIKKHHRKLADGYVTSVSPEGLIVANPSRPWLQFPWIGMLVTLLLFMLFKGFLYASLGEVSYDGRVDRLSQGGVAERGGAFLMQADPATRWIAQQMSPLI